jgi:hypothetical protein
MNPEPDRMSRSYVQVMVLEAVVLVALWVLGRAFL